MAELRSYDIGRADPASDYARAHPDLLPMDGERIPLLSEVVAIAKMAAKPFTLFVELKTSFAERAVSAAPEALAEATFAVLKAHDYLQHTIFVGFDWPGLVACEKNRARCRMLVHDAGSKLVRGGCSPARERSACGACA